MDIEQYYVSNDWAIASDGIQWVLQKRHGNKGRWDNLMFVSTERSILERCMRDKYVPTEDATVLLLRLAETFKEWRATNPTPDDNNALRQPLKATTGHSTSKVQVNAN